ncbi:uncharacterized protein LOC129744857 [Uranotaenia lowii]|uniref:uncharacterized protein LOC129744857 n=1 Tax=Uranotaenia lowii TaxID=190385 RepID=UPI00247A654C|nr:uncharacterized protein LOC129744857 [Uranotaenia lowii]
MIMRRRTIDQPDTAHRETWVSTNKILNSSLSAKRINSRNPNFDYEETKLLISLWGDPNVQKTLITTHKKHPVIAELARKMREFGYTRSTEEINTRIKNLKCFYNRIKKDMAAGVINQTTWKHYAEMDEIISRPVFGNAHRLHLMQQQKEQDELKQQILEQQEQMQRFPVKLEVMSDDDSTEIRAEDLLTIDTDPPPSEDTATGAEKGGIRVNDKTGKTRASNNALEKEALDIKDNIRQQSELEEDDDDDDDYDGSDFDVENEFNDGLDEILSKVKPSLEATAAKRASPKPSVQDVPTSTTSAAGKISVVPTNLLLKPPSANVSMNSPIQIYTQPTVSLAPSSAGTHTIPASITTVASGAGMTPMKLLLVNTVSKDGTTKQILTPASELPSMSQLRPPPALAPKPSIIPIAPKPPTVSIPTLNMIHKPPTMSPMITASSVPKLTEKPVFLDKEDNTPGIKALMKQLVAVQRENLAVSRNRLALERERLEFEKQIGGPLVDVIKGLSGFFNGFIQSQQQQLKQQQQQQLTRNPTVNESSGNEADAPVAKKRRTQSNSDKSPPPTVTTTETIKAEIISDSEDK